MYRTFQAVVFVAETDRLSPHTAIRARSKKKVEETEMKEIFLPIVRNATHAIPGFAPKLNSDNAIIIEIMDV